MNNYLLVLAFTALTISMVNSPSFAFDEWEPDCGELVVRTPINSRTESKNTSEESISSSPPARKIKTIDDETATMQRLLEDARDAEDFAAGYLLMVAEDRDYKVRLRALKKLNDAGEIRKTHEKRLSALMEKRSSS